MIRLWVRFLSGTQKVFLREQLESVHVKNIITKLPQNILDKSVAYIKKASQRVINKLYTEYECKQMQKANEFLTDLLISRFANTLGGLDATESPEELTKELNKDELLKRDVHLLVERITPYILFLGIISGGITTAKHVYGHKTNKQEEPEEYFFCIYQLKWVLPELLTF